jgi:hypothetical protein
MIGNMKNGNELKNRKSSKNNFVAPSQTFADIF